MLPTRSPLLLAAMFSMAAILEAAENRPTFALWPNGAPGSETRKSEPEKIAGGNISNIHHPSVIAYLPRPDQATGAAVIVAPGGGHQRLVIQHEGYNVGEWLAARGIAAFVLKYRLGRDDATPPNAPQPYAFDVHGLADAHRAIRFVRSRAAEWKINPAAVGIMGFSAGGEVAFLSAMKFDRGNASAADPIDRMSSRPDFQALIYPGKSQLIQPTKDSPPVFLACGYGDRPDISEGLARVYLLFKQAGVPAELHIYAGTGHGFGVRDTNKSPAGAWIERFQEWLVDRKFLTAAKP
ncbi:MAG: alpha/beta hydrolase [Opitutaceae bacterium]|nr:alpha/beta hydrolase [Opitutaceae bacterium]